jgi:hypothetical protein
MLRRMRRADRFATGSLSVASRATTVAPAFRRTHEAQSLSRLRGAAGHFGGSEIPRYILLALYGTQLLVSLVSFMLKRKLDRGLRLCDRHSQQLGAASISRRDFTRK